MATKKFFRRHVSGILITDSDSEGSDTDCEGSEWVPSGDDDLTTIDLASPNNVLHSNGTASQSNSVTQALEQSDMSAKKFSCEHVSDILLAVSNSGGENVSFGDNDDSISDHASHNDALHSSNGAVSGILTADSDSEGSDPESEGSQWVPSGDDDLSDIDHESPNYALHSNGTAGQSNSVTQVLEQSDMSAKKFSCEHVSDILLADLNSGGENVCFGNNDLSTSDHASHNDALHSSNGAAGQIDDVAQVHTHSDINPLHIADGRGACDISMLSKGGGHGNHSKGSIKRAGNGDDYADWVLLRSEEEYEGWIKPFDEPLGYHGDKEFTQDSKPFDFLSLFLTGDFWDLITTETNRYAHQFIGSRKLGKRSHFREWYDVTVSEMKAFMSLHFSMGLVQKSALDDYWATFGPTYTPGFAKLMPRNRFKMILSFLHFANNEKSVKRGQPGHDRIFLVRPLIDTIIPRFSAVYSPNKELSLDEMTIAFKGRSILKQYNPNKPDKYGYKAFVLSEANSGYVLQWSMYTGQNVVDDADAHLGATHLIVRQLMARYSGKGHEVYMDSYYTSPGIAEELAKLDTGLCGTVSSKRRGMPRDLTKAALPLSKWGDPVFMRRGKMLACAWHDTKRLTMLSTIHGNSCVRKQIRTKLTESGFRDINRPLCVDRYNTFMGGVDTADQRMKTYLFPHRARKWDRRLFNALMSICMVNAHIIYCRSTAGPHKPLKVFVQSVITSLIEGFTRTKKTKGRPSPGGGEMEFRLTDRHWLRNADDRPDCVVCSDRTRPKGRCQTRFRCNLCGVGLCAVPCNERYHTLKNYRQCHLDRTTARRQLQFT